MARLLADENFPLPTVERLRELGHDVRTAAEVNLAGKGEPDQNVFAVAQAEGRGILTFDRRDYLRLHMRHPGHAGMIGCTFDQNFTSLAERIHAAIVAAGELSGQFLRVNRPHPTQLT